MEVDLMSELLRIFAIPMELGNLIFRKLQASKGGSVNFTVDDLCKMIDEYRLGKIEA